MQFSEDEIEKFRKAGKIAAVIRDKVKPKIKEGVKLLDIAEFIEGEIRKAGAQPAFPVNISINDIAAHYTPIPNDESVFKQGNLVKVDFGAHVDGYPSDLAFSVSIGEKNPMIKIAEEALELAVSMCKPGTPVGEIGAEVQKLIESQGYKPISNLTGHSMERWDLHSGISVPNVGVPSSPELEEGSIFAIEPFVTNGGGKVHSTSPSQIFNLQSMRVRLPKARKALVYIAENFNALPFTSRWLPEEYYRIFPYLVTQRALHQYPILKEVKNGLISQAEHTVLIKDKPEVLT
jgi:methionyl aminopeptidase